MAFWLRWQVLMWVGQMADALSFVHSHNIIHRDIKSQNFFVNAQGELRLGDFGLCRKALPHTITVGGTDVYMAPEVSTLSQYVPASIPFVSQYAHRDCHWQRPYLNPRRGTHRCHRRCGRGCTCEQHRM
eukprot:SAG11_NODE_192_length_12931_cov_5.747682_15_plen_129_part_00